MSKLSFRARALDATKSMPIFRKHEVSDLPDYSVLNRAVPQMPTGMEKEEESEHHLQRAISAQQVYGDKKVMVIPVPEAEVGVEYYNNVYKKSFRLPKQYIHNQAQALNSIMEQERPDYDMDSDDERWVRETNKRTGLEISEIQFEEMIDRLEKSCGNQAVTLQEAKLLLKEDDDLIKAVYEYWLQKRKADGPLIYRVRQEKRDGSSSGDSYVAFRRRTEKMQTRKNRKNDEASYEKMLKLRRDLSRAVTILEMIKRREKSKRELLHLSLEIAEKRYQMKDWDGKSMKMARREVALSSRNSKSARSKALVGNRPLSGMAQQALLVKQKAKMELGRQNGLSHKKRRYKKLDQMHMAAMKHDAGLSRPPLVNPAAALKRSMALSTPASNSKSLSTSNKASTATANSYPAHIPSTGTLGVTPKSPGSAMTLTYQQVVETMNQYEFQSSDEESRTKSPISGSVAPEDERKRNPDGIYALKRKPGCKYVAPRDDLSGDNWPWMTDDRHRYSLTTLTVPEKCVGFCRRRVGRGGRVMLDRAYSPWTKQLGEIDLNPEVNHLPHRSNLQELLEEIKRGRWRRYRPYDPLTHKAHKLLKKDNQREVGVLKSFGHSATSLQKSGDLLLGLKGVGRRADSGQVSSDSETVDIMTTDEGSKGDLLQKRLLQRSPHKSFHVSSPHRSRLTPQKHILVQRGTSLDKTSAMFAVSALVSSATKSKSTGLPATHRPKSKSHRMHPPLKLNVVSASPPNTSPARSASVAVTYMANLPTTPQARYATSAVSLPGADSSKQNKSKSVSKYALDHAKYFGKKPQDKLHTTLVSVGGLHANSSTANSVTFTVSNSAPKVSLTTTSGGLTSSGVISLTVAQASTSGAVHKSLHPSIHEASNGAIQRLTGTPVTVMATLRISNPASGTSTNSVQGALITNSNGDARPTLNSSYALSGQATSGGDSPNTVIIAPSTRIHYTKAGGAEQQVAGNVPLTLTTVNPTLVATHLVGQQSLGNNLNLAALTPTTPQKSGSLSQLSIPQSGHASAVLIATPATGTVVSSVFGSSVDTVASTVISGSGLALNQPKTVNINLARVQTPSSGIGQIFTLQHNADVNVATLTTSGGQGQPGSQHSSSTWVASGSGPNILKLGPPGVATGIQIRPVNSEPGVYKMGLNKSLTVIPKRPRAQQPTNATRTISFSNAKQQGQQSLLKPPVSTSHITLLSEGRNSLPKPLISISHPQKNASVLLAAKNVPVIEQDRLLTSESCQIPAQLNTPAETVGDSSSLNSKATKTKPMEVT